MTDTKTSDKGDSLFQKQLELCKAKIPVNERCVKCGWDRKEHAYNGACYGICDKFQTSPTRTGEKQ